MKKNLYIQFENNFFDKIINRKRIEMINIIIKKIKILKLKDLLDIGTTQDTSADSSNIFCTSGSIFSTILYAYKYRHTYVNMLYL